MINKQIVQRKLLKLKEYLRELEILEGITFEQYETEVPKKRMAERDIQLIVECASDINSHILVESGQMPPRDYFESFTKIVKLGIYSESFAHEIARFAGLRNRLVHEYEEIKDKLVYKNLNLLKEVFPQYIFYIEKFIESI